MEKYIEKLIKDINDLGEDLINIKSETGLLMQQHRVQNIYEKFIFFKLYRSKKFENIEKYKSEENIELKIEEPFNDNFKNNIQEKKTDKISIENSNDIITTKEKQLNETNTKNNNDIIIIQEKQLNEINTENNNDIIITQEKKYADIQLNINDKIAFIAKLFGDVEKCKSAIQSFNQIQNKNDSLILFNKMSQEFNWAENQEFAERLKELIENRFNS